MIVDLAQISNKNQLLTRDRARYNPRSRKWERPSYAYIDNNANAGKPFFDADMAYNLQDKPIKQMQWVELSNSEVQEVGKEMALEMAIAADGKSYGVDESGNPINIDFQANNSFQRIAKKILDQSGIGTDGQLENYFISKIIA